MKLNLGCSDRHIVGYVNVDLVPPCDQVADLAEKWPWADSSIESVAALDVIEHIGECQHQDTCCGQCCPGQHFEHPCGKRRHFLGRIHFMNELHRVLVPAGRAVIETPNASKGSGYFQDPTHVSPWCLNSFQYFQSGSLAHNRFAKAYGITAAFRLVDLKEAQYQDAFEVVWKITAILEAVKAPKYSNPPVSKEEVRA